MASGFTPLQVTNNKRNTPTQAISIQQKTLKLFAD